MQQPLLIHPRDSRAAYDYFSIRAAEDRDERPVGEAARGRDSPVWRTGSPPNYKPTALRWPFISTVIALLLVAIVLVVVAEKKMPDSDSTAVFVGIHPNASQPLLFARDVVANTSASTVEVTASKCYNGTNPIVHTVDGNASFSFRFDANTYFSGAVKRRQPAVIYGTVDNTRLDVESVAIISSSSSVQRVATTSTTSLPSGARVVPISSSVSRFTSYITVSLTTVVFTSVIPNIETIPYSSESTFTTTLVSTMTGVSETTFQSFFTANGTRASAPASTATHTEISVATLPVTETITFEGVTTVTGTDTITGTSVITGVVIPSVGEVTITYYSTILPGDPPSALTQAQGPVQVTGIEVVGGTTVPIVQTQGPVLVAVPTNVVQTEVVGGQVSTGVVSVAGTTVTNVVVITPSQGSPAEVVTTVGGTPVTVVSTPAPVTVVTTVNGVPSTIVETPPPQTVVRTDGGVATTLVAGQPFTQTIVNTIGGTPVTQVVVTTPSGPPFQPITYTVVSDAGGTLVTEVIVTTPTGPAGQPITYTAVDIVGGTPVTQVVVTTLSGATFQPVSFTIATEVGGTPTVITITPSRTTVVETISGTPITRVITFPVTSFTATVGGTLTTEVLVTTPTATGPITLTLVSTLPDSLSTFTTTIPPTTILTTISSSMLITSTPPPTTSFSTRPRSTHTFTSTSTPSAGTNSTTSNGDPTVVASTKVFRWTEADIFLGTFLPALLGVALVIPLRIIDLNAKLYQPFQTLAQPGSSISSRSGGSSSGGGAPGSDTLLLQYTGLMAFVAPAVTLLRGRPVPFLTTVVVACASLMVPLATEAVGLKMHGVCYLNTASPATCGPALGVSPVPAHVLEALLAAVVVVLLVVLVLVRRWVTGVRANPWNLAGAASLAGSPHVRIRQGSERAMRRAMADKLFGLGYFRNADGREEYGIVLMDEAGRGLREEGVPSGGDTESELLDDGDEVGVDKWGDGRTSQLPFMALRYPWRIAFMVFQLAVLIFVIYYYAYYRSGVRDNGRLWQFLNTNTFGVRFVSAIIGVIIAFCWQIFFLSVSTMTAFRLLSLSTQPARTSILLTPSTNPFSGLYSAVRHRLPFPAAVSLAAILSEFLPVLLSNVPFNLAQTATAATACAVLSCVFLGLMLAVLAASFAVRYPPMPVDPRSVGGLLWYVSRSRMVVEHRDFEGVSLLDGKERAERVEQLGRRYFYGVLAGDGNGGRRLGVDCDVDGGEYLGAAHFGQGLARSP
ncbi:ab9d6019-1f64-4f61-8860-4b7de751d1fb [Thermothielavioides terrestris]|uniref:Ab9d6019-1f64-4f61-8860-4b7de751d1fb n=1 Tax=Thermothielavioides terrestris TaxID=2587410 RepID=A0A446B7D6_9PEZI|nr:ab9d6019-1f64-4f61-8860-4b7de751d1fb [Thermothielavioides terrestris]